MARQGDPDELAALVALLGALRGWSKTRLAQASGIHKSRLSVYELGRVAPSQQTQERLAAAVGLPLSLLEPMKAFLRRLREALEGPSPAETLIAPASRSESAWKSGVCESVERLVSQARAELKIKARHPSSTSSLPADTGASRAEALWERLKPFPAAERRVLVGGAHEYQDPFLCQFLCAESERAAASDTGLAQELAELALLVAEHAPGSPASRSLLQGYAWAFVGNSRRVASNLPAADVAFDRYHRLWNEGAAAGTDLFDEARLLDLEASLRRDQRRFAEALALHDRALAAAKPEDWGSILVNKAVALEQNGAYLRAVEELEKADALIHGDREPRLLWCVRFNQAVNLFHLGRLGEAEPLLAEARDLAERLGNELDLVRVRWLTGRVAAGRGRKEEALAAFAEVRREFADRDMGYDCALVSLELAVLLLEEGRTREVQELAQEMRPLFQAQGVHREAFAALELFCKAAGKETLTAKLARRLVAYLYRAQHDPKLRFAG